MIVVRLGTLLYSMREFKIREFKILARASPQFHIADWRDIDKWRLQLRTILKTQLYSQSVPNNYKNSFFSHHRYHVTTANMAKVRVQDLLSLVPLRRPLTSLVDNVDSL